MASGLGIPIRRQTKVAFRIGPQFFPDRFLILSTTNSVVLGNQSFKNHSCTIDPNIILLPLTKLTVQLNQILPEKVEKNTRKF